MQDPVVIYGNLFTSSCQTLVNTVNCVGIMGAGIALEFRLRYPEMLAKYVAACESGAMKIGNLLLYKATDHWVLNFPTKVHWRYPTKESYIHEGLEKFMATYADKGIESVAFPLLGAQHGGLDPSRALEIMLSYLRDCTIPVEIYRHNPKAPDDMYESFKRVFLAASLDDLKRGSGLRSDYISRIREALADPDICQMNQLARVKGIGPTTLERAYAYARIVAQRPPEPTQTQLDA